MIKLEEIAEKYKGYEVDENKLKEFLVEPKPKSVWDLKVGDKYYFIDDAQGIIESTWVNETIDINRRNIGNCFLTRKDAEFEVMRRKVENILLKYGRRGFKKGKINHYITYIYDSCNGIYIQLSYDFSSTNQGQGIIYFDTFEQCQRAIIAAGEDNIKKYIFGVKD